MSNPLSIAAVTTTLRFLLQQRFDIEGGGTVVTTKPLDKARDSNISNGNQVNLFLYHTQIHPGWRNMDIPDQVKPGETGQPLLPLNLYYLLTAYSQNDDYPEPTSHRLLGLAMRVLHDHSTLTPADIKAALPANTDYDLEHQVEQMRISYQALSVEESFNLWTIFQSPYRISAAYEVSVVLIESGLPTKAPLPAIRRQADDSGPILRSDLLSFLPTLLTVQLPNQQANARLGDVLILNGYNLDGESVVILFTNTRREITVEVPSLPERTATDIRVQLPDNGAQFVAGFYTVAVRVTRTGQQTRTSNELPFSLAPRILDIIPRQAARDANGEVMLTLVCSPQVQPEQRVALLLGDREILAQPRTTLTDRLEFRIVGVTPGEYFVRLRIDGVDSLLVDRTVTPPVFDQNQKVTII
jgi:Pvc16 N-terminal domain